MRPHDLRVQTGISAVAIHKHIRRLLAENLIERRGVPPRVVYVAKVIPANISGSAHITFQAQGTLTNKQFFNPETLRLLEKHFCYFSPSGKEVSGVEAFLEFLRVTNQDQKPAERAEEYVNILTEAETFRGSNGLIDGSTKIRNTFNECFIEQVFYSEFYSLPKYGKTRLGQYLLHGKTGQNRRLIERICVLTKSDILEVISTNKIDAIVFTPHSIPRKLPFLDEYRRLLTLPLPEIKLDKLFSGDVPIAQKSLAKLTERIENARDTFFVRDNNFGYKRILIIDDALGSGATVNEIARKLHMKSRTIFAYVIVGSYKGFEVLREV